MDLFLIYKNKIKPTGKLYMFFLVNIMYRNISKSKPIGNCLALCAVYFDYYMTLVLLLVINI